MTRDLGQALAALQDGDAAPWAALAPLSRLPQNGVDVAIDFTASDRLGAAIVIARPHAPHQHALNALTPRQRQVAEALARGDSNKEIAVALGLSPATVKDHVENLLRRLGLRRRGQVAAVFHGTTD